MKSGISRYTKGGFNQSALNDVYNKAKEIYVSDVEPPASGVITNTMETIFDDMTLINDLYPSGKPSSFSQFWSGNTDSLVTFVEGWAKANCWWESDLQTADSSGCTTGLTSATNTCMEVSNGEMWWLDDNGNPGNESAWTWRLVTSGGSVFTGGTVNHSGQKCADESPFIAQREETPANYNTYPGEESVGDGLCNISRDANGYIKINPIKGWRYHAWVSGSTTIDRNTIQAMYGSMFFRLVLIDPNGVDDRHLYNQVVHMSSDIKAADGSWVPGYEYWGVGGLTRYKKVPNNGDWMPLNFMSFRSSTEGYTQERITRANPPLKMLP